ALANDPQLILADEPTANLDSRHGHEVVELLHDIAKAQRRTIVIVSHDHRIRDVADRVLWLQDGRFEHFEQPDAHQSAMLQTADVLYGAAPHQAAPEAAASATSVRRGVGWFPWRLS